MNIPLNADNFELETTLDGRITAEISFVAYLREHGYPIDGVSDGETIQRADSDTGHMVYRIETLSKPTSHPESDAVADQIQIPACDCWNYRQSTPDVGEGETLEGFSPSCPHIRDAFREERAREDDEQDTLGQ